MASERVSRHVFVGVAALLFAASVAATWAGCASMAGMGDMPMPGGWTMSMMWMRMPGQTWLGSASSFLGMWVVMMVAMMLPSVMPMLWRYRQSTGRAGGLTILVGVGYFFVWAVFGMAVFPLGVASAALAMQQPALARAVPAMIGVVVLLAGALQFTRWKTHHLACCRKAPGRSHRWLTDAGAAWRYGLRQGLHCCYCCVGLTAALLVIGSMDPRAMVLVAVAIAAERLAPAGERVARAMGVVIIGVGLCMVASAVAQA
jgi:predicted metal-binding membrane protein